MPVQEAQAGTWYIHPRIVNATKSTLQAECGGGHLNWTGCAIHGASGVDDGKFITNHYGATGAALRRPVFTLERASLDGRRWTRVAARNMESSLTARARSAASRCHRGRPDSTGTKACVWRRAIFGAFAHRDRVGQNTVSFARRLDGHALAPISKPVSARFRIAS